MVSEETVSQNQTSRRRSFDEIPVETWAEIFSECVRASTHIPLDLTTAPSELIAAFTNHIRLPSRHPYSTAPYRLASVCRFWREIVLTTPRCWAFVTVDICSKECDFFVPGLLLHLQRSQDQPLDVFIRTRRHESHMVDLNEQGRDGVEALRVLFSRAQSLTLMSGRLYVPLPARRRLDPSLPLLQYLSFGPHASSQPTWFYDAVRRSPKLRILVHSTCSARSLGIGSRVSKAMNPNIQSVVTVACGTCRSHRTSGPLI
ncbi:hypothetical protein V5O48_006444 [Marasmius crinis-equi]|uniref:F-box domain-containing protein n=1 Tax=Marasmius crinis-equi TaxID=585013 RepID=A0ABR3FK10_9AGAR